ncbi:ribokinase [soil metagenome]
MAAVWVIGSLNVDLVSRVERFPGPGETVAGEGLRRLPGGKGANQAVAAAAAGASVRMIGRVGDDTAGSDYLAALADRGVDVSAVTVESDCATGHAMILLDRHGENCIVVIPGANGRVGLDDLARFEPAAGDVLLLQLEVPTAVIAAAVAAGSDAGATVLLNLSPYQDLDPELVRACDVIVVNEHEAAQLAASGLEPASVVITRGSAGASWQDVTARSAASEVIDTTGAGDAFAGALAAALVRGDDHQAALQAAVSAGAAAVGQFGAQGWEF